MAGVCRSPAAKVALVWLLATAGGGLAAPGKKPGAGAEGASDAPSPMKETPSKGKRPVLTTETLQGTAELMYDFYAKAVNSVHENVVVKSGLRDKAQEVTAELSKQMPDDLLKVACEKVGCQEKVLKEKWSQTQDLGMNSYLQFKATAYELSTKAYEPVNSMAVQVVDIIEEALPEYRGLIPKTFGDLVLFVLYTGLVLFVIVKVALVVLRVVLSVFCCVCCCGCCRRRKGDTAAKKKAQDNKKEPAGAGKKPKNQNQKK